MDIKLPILLAEDNDDDALLLTRALRKAGWKSPITRVRNGLEAAEYLEARGRFADRNAFPFPGLLLLDLKMPGMSGIDFLEWLRNREELRSLAVIVLSGSEVQTKTTDLTQYRVHLSLVKTARFENLIEQLKEFAARLKD